METDQLCLPPAALGSDIDVVAAGEIVGTRAKTAARPVRRADSDHHDVLIAAAVCL
jgi:hypothetical protein